MLFQNDRGRVTSLVSWTCGTAAVWAWWFVRISWAPKSLHRSTTTTNLGLTVVRRVTSSS